MHSAASQDEELRRHDVQPLACANCRVAQARLTCVR